MKKDVPRLHAFSCFFARSKAIRASKRGSNDTTAIGEVFWCPTSDKHLGVLGCQVNLKMRHYPYRVEVLTPLLMLRNISESAKNEKLGTHG